MINNEIQVPDEPHRELRHGSEILVEVYPEPPHGRVESTHIRQGRLARLERQRTPQCRLCQFRPASRLIHSSCPHAVHGRTIVKGLCV